MAVLTSDQQAKLKDLKGEEFDVAQLRGGRGGRGGGRGGAGGGRGGVVADAAALAVDAVVLAAPVALVASHLQEEPPTSLASFVRLRRLGFSD